MATLVVAPPIEISGPAVGPVHVTPDAPLILIDDDVVVPTQLIRPPPRLTVEVDAAAIIVRPTMLDGTLRKAPKSENEPPPLMDSTVLKGPVWVANALLPEEEMVMPDNVILLSAPNKPP